MDRHPWLVAFEENIDMVRWKEDAACKGMDINIFFAADTREAKAVCKRCQTTQECMEYARRFEDAVGFAGGVYGGKSSEERRKSRVHSRQIPRSQAS
jgi:WhiB family redox-sensing transcriptional regulator